MADISKIKLPSDNTTYNIKDASALHSISGTSPISVSGSAISHAESGVAAASKGDTTNQTPAFGGTFKALSGTVNATGHLTAFAEHTVTIPNAAATTSAAGLMSAADKTKLDTGVADTPITSAEIDSIIALIPAGLPYAEGEDF